MYEISKDIAPKTFADILNSRPKSYSLHFFTNYELRRPRVNSVLTATETFSYLGPKLWDLLSLDVKERLFSCF